MTTSEPPEDALTSPTPDNDTQSSALVEVNQQSAWSGPLPPPMILDQFNDVVENGAERIVSAWEGETAHRQAEEKRELTLERPPFNLRHIQQP